MGDYKNRSRRTHKIFFVTAGMLLLAACSVNVKKEKNGDEKQVDINTLVGGIHVNKGVDPADVGIAIYPGSHLRDKGDNGDTKAANVDISGFGYGLKVVALEYESNDAPEKILSYYRDQLKKYGSVLECHSSHFDFNADIKTHQRSNDHELNCEGGGSGTNVELKVGTKENQHIVAVRPEGAGSRFSLVYVRTHGKTADI
jgi:hypothetical protein